MGGSTSKEDTTEDVVELALITLAIIAVGLLAPDRSSLLSLGWCVLGLSLLLLIQGFFRDLWLLYREKARTDDSPRIVMKCLCLESTLGTAGIIIGGLVALLVSQLQVEIDPTMWPVATGSVMLFGFATKNVIVTWRPLGVRPHD